MPTHDDGLVTLDELASVLRVHEGPPEPRSRERPPKRRLRPRWVGVAVAAALLIGSALGFGLGSWAIPSGSAGGKLEGVGLLPARGWTIVQSRAKGSTGASSVVAANVPIDTAVRDVGLSRRTLERLPTRGILIAAKFSPRGDPAVDLGFPLRRLPLRLSDATAVPSIGNLRVAEYRLRAAVEGYNIDAAIYFGALELSRSQIAAAQRQLGRLFVGATRVTIFARLLRSGESRIGLGAYELYGSVDTGKADEGITIQAKDCGQDDFRAAAGTTTRPGGGWSLQYYPGINTTVRAVWKGEASAQVKLQQHARVGLYRNRSGKQFRVSSGGKTSFWRKRVLIQGHQHGRWTRLKTVVLTETHSQGGYYAGSGASADFNVSVPRGTLIRAVLPTGQVRPCYLGGMSDPVRT
jgi:hypothetical protein